MHGRTHKHQTKVRLYRALKNSHFCGLCISPGLLYIPVMLQVGKNATIKCAWYCIVDIEEWVISVTTDRNLTISVEKWMTSVCPQLL